jgi:hypothetical protein
VTYNQFPDTPSSRLAHTATPTQGIYQIACQSPCGAVTYFRLEDMKAFEVSDRVYVRGYAEPGEYEINRVSRQQRRMR